LSKLLKNYVLYDRVAALQESLMIFEKYRRVLKNVVKSATI
jgi:hypothetical protein